MATTADIITRAETIKNLAADQDTKSQASHAAADNVAAVITTQTAVVAQAQAAANVAINEAQSAADAAKTITDDATTALNAEIEALIVDAKSLEK